MSLFTLLATEEGVQRARARLFPDGESDLDNFDGFDLDRSSPVAAQVLDEQEQKEATAWLHEHGFDLAAHEVIDDDDMRARADRDEGIE